MILACCRVNKCPLRRLNRIVVEEFGFDWRFYNLINIGELPDPRDTEQT